MTVSRVENQTESKLDWLKWTAISLMFVVGVSANYFYSQQPWPLRLLAWMVLLGLVAFLSSQTLVGKKFIAFARESKTELRKVVWPTRQETIQTTFIIAIMVVILAVILWGVDGVLVSLIGWLTGQRG